jgi:transcriptional regulator with XRE-family HTH domain
MSKPKTKPITNVVELIRDIADNEFVEELEQVLNERQVLKSLIGKRIAKGVSQGDIAERLGCSQSRVSKLERGTDSDLKLDELAAYGAATGQEFEIIGHRVGSRPVDRVKAYALCIHRELQNLASLAKEDDGIAEGVTGFFGETFFNLVNLLNDAARTLPERPLISIQLDPDVENEPQAEHAKPVRQRARRKRSRPTRSGSLDDEIE